MKIKNFLHALGLLTTIILLNACGLFSDDAEPKIELPANIEEYLSNNYPDYEVDEAEKEVDCTGEEVYEVELEAANDDELELAFSLTGNLLYSETEIKNEDLPEAVLNTISTNYSDYELDDAEQLDLASDGVEYEVELEKGKTELEVRFSADGTVICEQEDND